MNVLSFIGLCCGFTGAVLLAVGFLMSPEAAISLAKPYYADATDASTLAVQDRLRQSRLAKAGLSFLAIGFACQAVAAWPFRAAAARPVLLPSWLPHVVTGAGLALGFFAAWRVLPGIFVSDRELQELSELPLEGSTTNLTSAATGANLAVAVTDLAALRRYRKQYLDARKAERVRGVSGLRLLLAAFALQLAGLVLGLWPLPN